MEQYAQMAGRGGRDGSVCKVTLLYNRERVSAAGSVEPEALSAAKSMWNVAQKDGVFRKRVLADYFEGYGSSCKLEDPTVCDICAKISSRPRPHQSGRAWPG